MPLHVESREKCAGIEGYDAGLPAEDDLDCVERVRVILVAESCSLLDLQASLALLPQMYVAQQR